jgi:hypothetical protein
MNLLFCSVEKIIYCFDKKIKLTVTFVTTGFALSLNNVKNNEYEKYILFYDTPNDKLLELRIIPSNEK